MRKNYQSTYSKNGSLSMSAKKDLPNMLFKVAENRNFLGENNKIVTIDNGERYGTVPESFVSKIICNRITWPRCFNLALRNHRYSFVLKNYLWRKPKNNLTTYIKDTYILTRGLRQRHKYQLIVIYVSDCKYHYSIDQYTIYINL